MDLTMSQSSFTTDCLPDDCSHDLDALIIELNNESMKYEECESCKPGAPSHRLHYVTH